MKRYLDNTLSRNKKDLKKFRHLWILCLFNFCVCLMYYKKQVISIRFWCMLVRTFSFPNRNKFVIVLLITKHFIYVIVFLLAVNSKKSEMSMFLRDNSMNVCSSRKLSKKLWARIPIAGILFWKSIHNTFFSKSIKVLSSVRISYYSPLPFIVGKFWSNSESPAIFLKSLVPRYLPIFSKVSSVLFPLKTYLLVNIYKAIQPIDHISIEFV